MRIGRYLESQTLKRQFWQRTWTNVSLSLFVRFWNRLVFWKVQYVTSQTCVWGLQSEAQKSCKTFVLNHTDWDSHHQTKMSPRPLVRWCWCQVSCLFAEKLLVRLWVLSAQHNKSCRHATTQSTVFVGRETVNRVTVREKPISNVVTNISAEGLAHQSQPCLLFTELLWFTL